jgi:hypothetical protein
MLQLLASNTRATYTQYKRCRRTMLYRPVVLASPRRAGTATRSAAPNNVADHFYRNAVTFFSPGLAAQRPTLGDGPH